MRLDRAGKPVKYTKDAPDERKQKAADAGIGVKADTPPDAHVSDIQHMASAKRGKRSQDKELNFMDDPKHSFPSDGWEAYQKG